MKETYNTKGVCSSKIHFNIESGTLRDVKFENGCPGSLTAICSLVEGMPVNEAVSRLKGIRCGRKATSCPDQLARALEQYQALYPPE